MRGPEPYTPGRPVTVGEKITMLIASAETTRRSLNPSNNEFLTEEARAELTQRWGTFGQTLLGITSPELHVTYEPAIVGENQLPWDSVTFSYGENSCNIPLRYVAADLAEQQAIRTRFGSQN